MTTKDIGQKLVDLVKANKPYEAMEQLYAKDIVSLEAYNGPDREAHGLDKVLAKSKAWSAAHEIHSAVVEGPFPNGDKFAVIFKYDITRKSDNQRLKMEEVALYYVDGDKIVREEFYYPT